MRLLHAKRYQFTTLRSFGWFAPAYWHAYDMPERFRDLLLLDIPGRLVIACDVIGGIGDKPNDSVPTDPRTCANFCFRVPMLELLCSGARPVAVIDTLCVERYPTGQIMIEEITRLSAEAGVPAGAISGSTEDNVPTTATGLGVTILGVVEGSLPKAQPGDVVICVGEPKSAPADSLYIGHPAMVTIDEVSRLLATGLVHDALPVGSRGIAHEFTELAATSATTRVDAACTLDVEASGGPSTCILLACAPEDEASLHSLVAGRSWQRVGWLG